jgi:hypothetical protein
MKPDESAPLADHSDRGDRSIEIEVPAVERDQADLGGRVDQHVRTTARQADIFRPCGLKLSVNAIHVVLRG